MIRKKVLLCVIMIVTLLTSSISGVLTTKAASSDNVAAAICTNASAYGAASTDSVTVMAKKYANCKTAVYSKTNGKGTIRGYLSLNTAVSLLSSKADKYGYYKISYKGSTGYVKKERLVSSKLRILYTYKSLKVYTKKNGKLVRLGTISAKQKVGLVSTKKTASGYYKIYYKGKKTYVKATIKQAKVVPSQASVYKLILAQKSKYPEGKRFTNSNFYAWKGGIYSGGYGCSAFAFYMSDKAFGSLPARIHYDINNIKVGDILRINYDSHSVVVLSIHSTYITVAEGNYNSSVHWGRKIKLSDLKKTKNGKRMLTNIITRYQ